MHALLRSSMLMRYIYVRTFIFKLIMHMVCIDCSLIALGRDVNGPIASALSI